VKILFALDLVTAFAIGSKVSVIPSWRYVTYVWPNDSKIWLAAHVLESLGHHPLAIVLTDVKVWCKLIHSIHYSALTTCSSH